MESTDGPVLVVAVAPAFDRYVWVDELVAGAVNRPRRVAWQVGGKALNVARVLRQLGIAVRAVVPAPAADVDRVRRALTASGVDAVVVPVGGELRQTLTIIDDINGATTELYEPSPGLADSEWSALTTAAVSELDGASAVVVSGTRPGSEASSRALAAIATAAGDVRTPLYVDGRPATVASVLTAAEAAEIVVKVNAGEAAEVLGIEAPAGAAVCFGALARALVDHGATAAIVTAGTDGAAYAGRRPGQPLPDVLTVAGPLEAQQSPGGSGDAFLAGFVTGRLRGLAVVEALDVARRCAEANAAQPLAGDLGAIDVFAG